MRRRLLVLTCALLPALGCGQKLAPVSGKVTLDGKPLPNAKVVFQPIPTSGVQAGPASAGETNEQGEYTLKLLRAGTPGAVVGEHRVSITAPQGPAPDPAEDNPKPRKDLVPEQYNAQTELKCAVPPGGKTDANFELSSKPKVKPGSGGS